MEHSRAAVLMTAFFAVGRNRGLWTTLSTLLQTAERADPPLVGVGDVGRLPLSSPDPFISSRPLSMSSMEARSFSLSGGDPMVF
jgi:hypothetical protein